MLLLPKQFYKIKKIKAKGRGVFAKKDILPGIIIGDYLGRVLPAKMINKYEKKFGLYTFSYHEKFGFFPDLNSIGSHLINHACTPNCAFTNFKGHILIFALRKIFAGEELTYDYCAELDSTAKFYYPCYCQSPLCRGTMYANNDKSKMIWRHISKLSFKYIRKISKQKNITKLKSYPKLFKDNNIYDLFVNFEKKPITMANKIIPQISIIRKLIRQNGRPLYFSKINICVVGIKDNHLISRAIK